MNFTLLNDLIGLCAQKGITQAVLCPGSRSAPITLSFIRNPHFTCRTFSDERSAAFIAMGMAHQTKRPVALVCTSGSAAYNFAPAIAEAFFQQIPLLIFTADRPKEWIDQLDGQTIRQENLYHNHIKKYFELSINDSHPDAIWHAQRIINEAINLSTSGIPGPVQINVPLREPLYPATDKLATENNFRVVEKLQATPTLIDPQLKRLADELTPYKNILIVSGQNDFDAVLCESLSSFNEAYGWPVVGDILSNLHPLPFFIRYTDTFLGQASAQVKEALRPDLLITFGKSLVAKNLKLFLRNFSPRAHWHLQTDGESADTFQSLTRIIPLSPKVFFDHIKKHAAKPNPNSKSYERLWRSEEDRTLTTINKFFQAQTDGEFKIVQQILNALPSHCNLHLANSMSVRYANHIGLQSNQKNVLVYSNRGTSGIDGCTSTSVGHALTSDRPNILITGDQAFFYDRNAFWHNYPIPNLFVVVLNNHGGIIFNLIDGPSNLPEAEEYFITRQKLNAKSLAAEFGYTYASGKDLKDFFNGNGNVKLLEIESSQRESKKVFETFKSQIKNNYGK